LILINNIISRVKKIIIYFYIMKKLILILFCLPMVGYGQQTFNFMHNGLNREYIYYAPANLPVDAPLVFVAHGFTGSAQGIMSYCGMNTIADQNSFAVCYPQGTTDSWGDNFWNVGYNFHAGVTIDDVDFIVSLASYLQSTYQLNAINTFFTGMSNGGELSYLLACEGPNVFRAFAPVAGTIFPNGLTNNICSPIVPVSIFETHGRNDNVTLIEGDLFDQYWGPYLSIDTIINFWVAQNSLTNLVVDTFPNLNNNNKITISYKYSDPSTNNEVWLYTHKSGHNWGDDGDMVIEQEIWNFFSQMSFTAPSWDCVNNACIDPGTSTGMYLNLAACTSACVVSSIEEYATNKELLKVTDLLGRESKEIKNTLLFFISNDGRVEKKLILE
jgi:polyhydroxybutyrate depolymerase